MPNDDLDNLKADPELLMDWLRKMGMEPLPRKKFLCKYHADHTPSARVIEKDGRAFFRCYACMEKPKSVVDIVMDHQGCDFVAAKNILLGKSNGNGNGNGNCNHHHKPYIPLAPVEASEEARAEAIYYYNTPEGAPHIRKRRIPLPPKEPGGKPRKMFLFDQWNSIRNCWMTRKGAIDDKIRHYLYRAEKIAGAKTVYVCAGEKVADCIEEFTGNISTCNDNGEKGWEKWMAEALSGKHVIVLPDNDEPGQEFAEKVAASCYESGALSVKILQLPGLHQPKDDAWEWFHVYGHSPEEFELLAYDAAEWRPPNDGAKELSARVSAMISGDIKAIPFPWPALSRSTLAIQPGAITILAGAPSAAKSFFTLQCIAHWMDMGIRIKCFMLEDTRAFHLHRAVGQKASIGQYSNPEWLTQNASFAQKITDDWASWQSQLGRCIYDRQDETTAGKPHNPTLDRLWQWTEEQAQRGFRIICIDPISRGKAGNNRFIADDAFTDQMERIADKYGVSLFLVTHTDRTTGFLAGGQAYDRFTQTVLTIKSTGHETYEKGYVNKPMAREAVEYNRTVHIQKARLGRGTGATLAFTFQDADTRFIEHGVLEPEKKKGGRR